jgi:uncharacterized protein YegP (UPF0339 family)
MRFEAYRGRQGLLLRNQWRWRLRAKNGRIAATAGEGYNNRADCLNAIDLIRTEAAYAPIKGVEP